LNKAFDKEVDENDGAMGDSRPILRRNRQADGYKPPRRPENMKIVPKIASTAHFGPFSGHFSHFKDEKSSNKGFQTTTHKLPLCTPFRSLHTYTVQPWVEPEP
jgi:hypothetical protein